MIPLFYKLIFLAFMEGFQTPLRNLDNGNVYDSTSPWVELQKIYSLFKTLFSNLKGMILFGHFLKSLLL
jgi:hypothetical protein